MTAACYLKLNDIYILVSDEWTNNIFLCGFAIILCVVGKTANTCQVHNLRDATTSVDVTSFLPANMIDRLSK